MGDASMIICCLKSLTVETMNPKARTLNQKIKVLYNRCLVFSFSIMPAQIHAMASKSESESPNLQLNPQKLTPLLEC